MYYPYDPKFARSYQEILLNTANMEKSPGLRFVLRMSLAIKKIASSFSFLIERRTLTLSVEKGKKELPCTCELNKSVV